MEKGLSYDDVLLKPQKSDVTDLSQVDLSTRLSSIELEIPVLSAAMDTVTEEEMALELGDLGAGGVIHRFLSIEEQVEMIKNVSESTTPAMAAVGLNDQERASRLVDAGTDAVVIDIAHGHHEKLLEELKEYSKKFPDTVIIAGNVATKKGARDLEKAGADVIKTGIGPGSACTTREVAGAGVPQFTAVRKCSQATDSPIIADGGIRKPGDLVKALAAGAEAGMIGGMFAGTKETPGEVIEQEGNKYKVYRGMSTEEAARKRAEREDRKIAYEDKISEGLVTKIEFKGEVKDVIQRLSGGLRSGISYCGASSLREAQKKARFIEISESTQSRNGGHIQGF